MAVSPALVLNYTHLLHDKESYTFDTASAAPSPIFNTS